MVKFFILMMIVFASRAVFANGDATFTAWLEALKAEAREKRISEETIKNTFAGAEYLPRVIVMDRTQPEFISTFFSYIQKRVTRARVEAGRNKMQQYAVLLNEVELRYGVPKNILVAFWGLETNYGTNKGDFGLPSSLMTLAYEGRRAEFFRNQLFDMMRIVDAGHNNVEAMRGSWAGAMGHMQFMPSTFLAYSVDANADGRNDIWNSLPDAFFSAANYLSSIGWKQGEPVALEVRLPANFEYYQAQLGIRQQSKDWANLGVTQINGTSLPALENAAILLPQGWQGPAFLVATNFDVVMKWNRSVNYALSVSHLADQLLEDNPIVNGWGVDNVAITFNQAWAIQAKLNQMGYDCGPPDGYPGTKTQMAIRSYQLKHHLPADGYPSYDLFNHLMKE
jgi:membrane-bound lytic murein transglycosylase B